MFYTYADARKHEFFIDQVEDESQRRIQREKLEEVMRFAKLTTCRKKYLLNYFGEKLEGCNCGSCDNCKTGKETFDATIIAQKILSAVVRTGQRWGCNHIVNVLLGKKTPSITENGHDSLSVFGIVNDFTADELRNIFQQLVERSLLAKAGNEYPVFALSQKGSDFLRNKEKLELQRPVSRIEIGPSGKKEEPKNNPELFEILRALRKEIAEKEGVPPFVVFGDMSLLEMARYYPRNESEFKRIYGVGTAKLEKYGEVFLREVSRFVIEKGITPPPRLGKTSGRERRKNGEKPPVYAKTRELLDKKMSIETIAESQGFHPSTILRHIEKMIDSGERPDLEYLKPPADRFEAIKKAFAERGDKELNPVWEYFEGNIPYTELRLVRALLRAET